MLVGVPPEELEDGLLVTGGELWVLVVLVELLVVELDGGRLADAEVGTVSVETPLVSAAVVVPPLPQPAAAPATTARVRARLRRRRERSGIPLTSPAGPSAARSEGSR